MSRAKERAKAAYDRARQSSCNGRPEQRQALNTARQVAPPDPSRAKIVVRTEERVVNDEAVQALAHDDMIFQRGGVLVRVNSRTIHHGESSQCSPRST